MKPAKFVYHAPNSLAEALSLLTHYGGEARLLAGGQSLIPMMNFRIATPAAIIDLNRVPDLDYIRREIGIVRIGAMTRQRKIELSGVIAETLPLLRDAIKLVGHLPTRSREAMHAEVAGACRPFRTGEARLNALRRVKRRELCRIGLRDLLGDADLVTTTQELSELADACLAQGARDPPLGAVAFEQPLGPGVEAPAVALDPGQFPE